MDINACAPSTGGALSQHHVSSGRDPKSPQENIHQLLESLQHKSSFPESSNADDEKIKRLQLLVAQMGAAQQRSNYGAASTDSIQPGAA